MLKQLLPCALTVLMLSSTTAYAKQNLAIINNSSSEIAAIYISDSNTSDWEENLLPVGYVLPAGKQVNITLEPKYKKFDMRVETTEGGAEDFMEYPGMTKLIKFNGDGESEYE